MTARLPTHPYQWDGIRDDRALTPVEYCRCGLPRRHERHDLVPTPAEVTAVEQRILGETEPELEPTE